MQRLVPIFLIILLVSCTGQKKLMKQWIGSSKETLILDWGMPSQTVEVEPGGEILIFAREVKFRQFSGVVPPSLERAGGITEPNIERRKHGNTLLFLLIREEKSIT